MATKRAANEVRQELFARSLVPVMPIEDTHPYVVLADRLDWEKLSEIFQGTIEMIREDAEKRGIDLNSSPEETKAFIATERRREKMAEKLSALAPTTRS